MLLQLIYLLSGKNFIMLAIVMAAFATAYLLLIYKAGVSVGTFGNITSCLAGLVSPLSGAFAVRSGVFRSVFAFRLPIEMALIILAAAGMMKSGKKRPSGIVIILGNYLFCSIAGTIIPYCIQNPDDWIKTALMIAALVIFYLIGDTNTGKGSKESRGTIIPGSGDYSFSPTNNPYDNDGFTAYDRGTDKYFHYSLGAWHDQEGNEIPSACAHAWGLDDYYDKNIAGHDLTGGMPYDSKGPAG